MGLLTEKGRLSARGYNQHEVESRVLTGGVVPNRIQGVPATKKVLKYNTDMGQYLLVSKSLRGELR